MFSRIRRYFEYYTLEDICRGLLLISVTVIVICVAALGIFFTIQIITGAIK